MKEKTLVRVLVIVGALSLAGIAFSYFQLFSNMGRFFAASIPYTFCSQDSEGSFVLTKPTSSQVCSTVSNIETMKQYNVCGNYAGSKADACLGLLGIAEQRREDCLSGRVSGTADPILVKEYCTALGIEVLATTLPNFSVSETSFGI